tara:strand:+ start:924 stop:1142 length:219 start_codon:yes stop_codon:yes gene_type:complete
MDVSFLAPSGEYFTAPGLSNGRSSRDVVEWVGIDDFTVFNPYCHHYTRRGSRRVLVDYRIDYLKPLSGSGTP